ncbi:MAG: epoxyqueuosine reductase [Candidatus Lokiarchaeota archaeon]|nr:epoxyqueuosine reductase [Candidatus Lokiarchaeota archaeon]MBD3198955.1 epoxyqueuosine reductase [Candidatus Lokiarchaeota archaeon]
MNENKIKKEWIRDEINGFLEEHDSNKIQTDDSYIFDPSSLVGFVRGDDPIFEKYKEIIGAFHLKPREVFEKYCEKKKIEPNNKNVSVIAFILPISKQTKIENLEYSQKWPSERWAHTRLYGEAANRKLQKHLVQLISKEGILALAPANERFLFKVNRKHEKGVWASTWSHRHMAYAAGLGSFGLSDGFINEKGIAMRCGSIIVNEKLPSDNNKRPDDPYEYCSSCGRCIERCPVSAISFENGHDKQICSEHVMSSIPIIKKDFGINIYACGLCQVDVPCENGIPEK